MKNSSLFIEFIHDKRGFDRIKFKFNEKIVLVSNIKEWEKFFKIFLLHLRFAYEGLNLDMNERLRLVANEVNREYPRFRRTLGYIKIDREKMIPYLEEDY